MTSNQPGSPINGPQIPGSFPNGTGGQRPNQPSEDDLQIKKAQRLINFSMVFGPVSILIGGMLLSGAGVVCAIVAYRKLRRIASKGVQASHVAQRLVKSSIVAIVLCGAVFAVNAVSAWIMYPQILEMVQSNGSADFLGGNQPDSGVSSGSESAWG